MLKLLTKIFIKSNDINDSKVRTKYGLLSGIVGIVSNIIISIGKIISGSIVGSIAIIADGINNVSDTASSIIMFFGFRLSATPPDRKHPFGHKRIEYIAGVIVAVMIIVVGIILVKSSFEKIIHPIVLDFTFYYLIIIILSISILIKIWLCFFYRKVGRLINSHALIVSSQDSINDVLTTSVVLISLIIGKITSVKVDGYFGLIVAIYIVVSGLKLVKETISPLIGEAPDQEFVDMISAKIKTYDGVLGLHDLVVHSYGPNKCFATVHVEVDAKVDIMKSHEMIDQIELDFANDNINLVIHMDPVDLNNPDTLALKAEVANIINEISSDLSFHDFRIVKGKPHDNIIFDLVMPHNFSLSEKEIENLMIKKIKKINNNYDVIIIFDYNYIE